VAFGRWYLCGRRHASLALVAACRRSSHSGMGRTRDARGSLPGAGAAGTRPKRDAAQAADDAKRRQRPPAHRKGLRQLAFACARCDTLIVPNHGTRSVTARPTPVGDRTVITESGTLRVQQDSVFAAFL
jgi:hypothetical protein